MKTFVKGKEVSLPVGHTPTPKYGIDEAGQLMQDIGLIYAIRTLDPLTNEINKGSSTLTYCATKQQAEFICKAVNAHDALVEAARAAQDLRNRPEPSYTELKRVWELAEEALALADKRS